eukprot:Tbor_TRINITY_DN5718_c6_g4::TRINITY_DN5718_c6_g4_i1::g.19556::m.19556/K18423/CSE1, CAS, XPO2; exportin-2 (importin alpha re-exporter)
MSVSGDIMTLSAVLAATMEPQNRVAAEQKLKDYSLSDPNFLTTLLFICQQPQSSIDISVRMSSAVYIKNYIKTNWDSSSAESPISDASKMVVCENIFPVMIAAHPFVRKVISEAISLICHVDFPHNWPQILNIFVDQLKNTPNDISILSTCLSTAHSVFSRYRKYYDITDSPSLHEEMNKINSVFTVPLLNAIRTLMTAMIEAHDESAAVIACEALTYGIEAFYDTTHLDIGYEHEANYKDFIEIFLNILRCKREDIIGSEYSAGPLVGLQSLVLETITRHVIIADDDIGPFCPTFMKEIWSILGSSNAGTEAYNDLVVMCLKFIQSVCQGTQFQMLNNDELLGTICEKVLIPNLMVNDEDLELMVDQPDAYVAREVEGTNMHTRRHSSCELIRALLKTFPQKVAPSFVNYVQQLVTPAATASDWRSKSTAMTLMTAVALEGSTSGTQRGAAKHHTLTSYIPLQPFFLETVAPLLTPPETIPTASEVHRNVLVSDSIRFVATFRFHLDAHFLIPILNALTVWLDAPHPITSSFAAHTLERFLSMEQPAPSNPLGGVNQVPMSVPVVSSADVEGITGPVLGCLCKRLSTEKKPNTHRMLCLMRLCLSFKSHVTPFVGDIITHIAQTLAHSSKNPSNPIFSHAMFEVLSACISISPDQYAAIEGVLWEHIVEILSKDVVEYIPYTLQLLGQLLDCRPKGHKENGVGIPEHFQLLLGPLLSQEMYQQRGNIPAVVRLLTAFFRRDPAWLHKQGYTVRILEIFQMLLFLRAHDHDALNLLTVLIMNYPKEDLEPYLGRVYELIFRRLQQGNTPKYSRCVILFISIALFTLGVETVVTRVNAVQPGLFWMYVTNLLLKNVQKVTGMVERKVCIAGLAALICESETLQAEESVWVQCVYTCLEMIHLGEEKTTRGTNNNHLPVHATLQDLKESVGDGGFSNAFCPLKSAEPPVVDPCTNITDPNAHFKAKVANLLKNGGVKGQHLDGLLRKRLSPELLLLVH